MLEVKGKPRPCGFCQTPAVCTANVPFVQGPTVGDSELGKREYTCPSCGAVESIAVGGQHGDGSFTGSWYFGWKRADGKKLRAPTVGEMRGGKFGWQPDERAK
jgi:hypothetical protein